MPSMRTTGKKEHVRAKSTIGGPLVLAQETSTLLPSSPMKEEETDVTLGVPIEWISPNDGRKPPHTPSGTPAMDESLRSRVNDAHESLLSLVDTLDSLRSLALV